MARAVIRTGVQADIKPFERSMIQAGQSADRFKNTQIKQLGAAIGGLFAVRAVGRFVGDTLKAADSIDNMSRALVVSTEHFQTLKKIGERAGADVGAALTKLRKSMDDISDDKMTQKAFQDLGMSIEDVRASDPARMFESIAIAIKSAKDPLVAGAAAGQLLGRQYVMLNDVMNTVATDGLDNIKNGMLDVGDIMSNDMVAAADAFELAFSKAMDRSQNKLREWLMNAIEGVERVSGFMGAMTAKPESAETGRLGRIVGGMIGGGAGSVVGDLLGRMIGGDIKEAAKIAAESTTVAEARKEQPGRTRSAAAREAPPASATTAGVTVAAPQAADSLARIGGLVGPQTHMMKNDLQRMTIIAERQEKLQDRMTKALVKIEANTED